VTLEALADGGGGQVEKLRYDEDKAFLLADDAATIARIVRTTPAERLRETRFDEWTALEVIGHVTDAAEIFADRIERCLVEKEPEIASYDQDALARERRNNDRDPRELSKRLLTAHSRIVQLLQRPGAAERRGRHAQWGRVDAGHFAAYHADHAHGHIREIGERFPPVG
jgi:hypothetical protein